MSRFAPISGPERGWIGPAAPFAAQAGSGAALPASAMLGRAQGDEMDERKLKDAARPTLERIRADSERVSPKLKPFLDTIRERLLEPGFNVTALWRQHRIRNKSGAAYFHELGTTPAKYLNDARMDVAAYLLVSTHYQLWRVAGLLGVSVRTLGRRFKDRHGQTPEDYRRSGSVVSGETPETLVDKIVQGVHGRLDEADGTALAGSMEGVLDRLSVFYPRTSRPVEPAVLSGREFEAFQVRERIWPQIFDPELPFDEERSLVLASRGFSTPAFYERLHRHSREEGRKDRRRGVELAQLALDSLETNAETLGAHYPVLRPQAFAWLGNAYRLALDFSEADRAIDEAVKGLEKVRDPFATGIVHLCQGTLRTSQRRYDEAFESFDVSLPAFEEAGAEAWQVTTQSHLASALGYAGRHDLAIEALTKAATLPGAESKPFGFVLPFNIAAALAYLGRYSEAEKYLAASRTAEGFDDFEWRWRWVQAKVDHGTGRISEAEAGYRSNVRHLEGLDESLYSSLVLLDLAVLYAEQVETGKVIEICQKICPVFESLRMYDETLASVQLLGAAIASDSISVEILQDLRLSMLHDPLVDLRTFRTE